MKILRLILLTIYMLLGISLGAYAEGTNGLACKKHLNPLFEIQSNHLLAQEVYGAIPNAVGVPLSRFREGYETESSKAMTYITSVRRVLTGCKQACEGLRIQVAERLTEFQCNVLEKNSIATLAENISKIKDEDTTEDKSLTVADEDLDSHFDNTAAPVPAPPAKQPDTTAEETKVVVEATPEPATKTPVRQPEAPINVTVVPEGDSLEAVLKRLRQQKEERDNADIVL